MLASKFGAVFYCPGNHELWVRERDRWVGLGLEHGGGSVRGGDGGGRRGEAGVARAVTS